MSQNQIAFTAPHAAATATGQKILEQGGTAIEAMVAAAATIAVVYPHMNGLGGDGFWLISEPNKAPIAIDAAGKAAALATLNFYQDYQQIPARGARAAITVAGAVAGWEKALAISHQWQKPYALQDLFADAILHAEQGVEVTQSLADASAKTHTELSQDANFAVFLDQGKPLQVGNKLTLPRLGNTLQTLAQQGLTSFYQGDIAAMLAADLEQAGSPLRLADLHNYRAERVSPLKVTTSVGNLYNLPAPTQGVASLLILALYDHLQTGKETDAQMVHWLIEATKQAFIARNLHIADPSRVKIALEDLLSPVSLQSMLKHIAADKVQDWPHSAQQGDTVWMGACDQEGRMVSYIQSLYWEFGSGLVSPSTGIVWNNRGTSFSLEPNSLQQLAPHQKPFHTLNPAFAELIDGRRLSYGTMGGEGQPQTQAALFCRYVYQQQSLSQAIAGGRWLLGRTWGDESHNLKIEADIAKHMAAELIALGHELVTIPACNELMGHAGAVVCHTDGSTSAASDPRSDGLAIASREE